MLESHFSNNSRNFIQLGLNRVITYLLRHLANLMAKLIQTQITIDVLKADFNNRTIYSAISFLPTFTWKFMACICLEIVAELLLDIFTGVANICRSQINHIISYHFI